MRDHFTDPPQRRIGALCVIRNQQGQILIWNKKRHEGEPTPWGLPGGCAEENQDARAECSRLVQEKAGITVELGALLCVHRMPDKQYPDHLSKEGFNLVFDGGVLGGEPEFSFGSTITEAKFVDEGELGAYLPWYNEARTVSALRALEGQGVQYLDN